MSKYETIYGIRLANARALASKGKASEFAEALGVNASRVSQIIGDNPTKTIGSTTARRIEAAYELPRGWMDVIHSEINTIELTPEEFQFIEIIRTINKAGRVTALDLIKSLAVTSPVTSEQELILEEPKQAMKLLATKK